MNASRRGFIRGLAGLSMAGAGGCFSIGRDSGKIRLAAVGVMGKGFSDWFPMVKSGKAELVAMCDADSNMPKGAQGCLDRLGYKLDLSKVPFYRDYRRLLDDAGSLGIQAMTVSTPDHIHGAAAIGAMREGINVYVQKPLVRTLWELERFEQTAREYGVITQMGNQGSALDGLRRGTEVLRSGILGDVREVHVWTNRPIWPQGFLAEKAAKGPADPVQANLDWNAWLGPARMRNYRCKYPEGSFKGPWGRVYHDFCWRAFHDFGCGAFGDMACHTMNLPFRGLELGAVSEAECTMIEEKNDTAYPLKSVVRLTYAARASRFRKGVTLPPVTLTWYEGDRMPSAETMPQVVAALGKVPRTGCYIVGSKGVMVSTNDYGGASMIALKGEAKVVDVNAHEAAKAVARAIPFRADAKDSVAKGPGAAAVSADGHYVEFLDAINGIGPRYDETHSRCFSDIEYSIPQMEGILVGCIAQQVPGVLRWDSAAHRFAGNDAANALLKPYIREGYAF